MTNIFIIHGLGGHPDENWFPWLKKELEQLDHKVFVPQFPTPQEPQLANWLQTLEAYAEFITPETIFVGHSLGVPFILNVAEKHPMAAAFLVAGFIGKTHEPFDNSMKTFAQKPFDWPSIKRNCKNFITFHSDNDPYVSMEKANELAKHLDITPTIVKGAGHFNQTSGHTSFDLLLQKIKTITDY